jgi:MFS family permease
MRKVQVHLITSLAQGLSHDPLIQRYFSCSVPLLRSPRYQINAAHAETRLTWSEVCVLAIQTDGQASSDVEDATLSVDKDADGFSILPKLHSERFGPKALNTKDGMDDPKVLRTLALASLGGALEFHDFVIFVFFTGVISELFFPPELPEWSRQLQTYAIFAVGYLVRPLGGLVMAHFGDTRGRRQVFTLSIILMAASTFLIALLPTYNRVGILAPLLLLLLRVLQGAAIGGEAPGAWVFVAEHATPGRAGLAVGMLTSGLSFGILLGSLVATTMNAAFTPTQLLQGFWRIPFAFGGVLGFIAALLRRWLAETPVFLAIRAQANLTGAIPLRTILTCYRGEIGRSFVLTSSLTAWIVVTILMTPSLLHNEFRIPLETTQLANLFAVAGLCAATVCLGWLSDLFGLRRVALISTPCSLLAFYELFAAARHTTQYLTVSCFIAGLGSGCVVFAPIMILKLFAPAVRFTGFAFSYNVAYAFFGGIAPLVVSSLSRIDSLIAPHYVSIASLLGLAAILQPVNERRDGVGVP